MSSWIAPSVSRRRSRWRSSWQRRGRRKAGGGGVAVLRGLGARAGRRGANPGVAGGVGLVLGGAASNVAGWLLRHGVVDYIPIAWPVRVLTNTADLALAAGLGLIGVGLAR